MKSIRTLLNGSNFRSTTRNNKRIIAALCVVALISCVLLWGTNFRAKASAAPGATNGKRLHWASPSLSALMTSGKLRAAVPAYTVALAVLPAFSIDDVSHFEGAAGTTSYVFTITKTGDGAASVQYQTQDGTATTADNDYVAHPLTTLNFGVTDTTSQITVLANGDTTTESNEAFTVELSNAVDATISDSSGAGAILNDDPQPSTVYVDDDWIAVPPGTDPDGAGLATSFGYDAFATIQAGVNAVTNPGTVIVHGGTYTENVTVNRTLSLRGAQFGVDARGRVASESVWSPATAANGTLILNTTTTATVVDGFSFTGGASLGVIQTQSGADYSNLQISNNLFSGYSQSAVFLNRGGSNITIDKNVMDGSSIAGSGQAIFGNGPQSFHGLFITNNNIVNNTGRYGFFVDGDHNVGESATRAALISGNLFNNNLQGLNLGSRSFGKLGAPVLGTYAGTISNNTFSDHTANGIQGGIQHVLVSGNTFSNNAIDGLALTSFGSANADRGAQNSLIVSNTFTGNGRAGIFFTGTQGVGLIETNHANFNRIVGNLVGVQYGGSVAAGNNATIDVENNWWGCNFGPGAGGIGCTGAADGTLVFAGNTGVLDSDPWLMLSINASPNPITPGDLTTVTADLIHNSNNAVPSATLFVPPTPVTFGSTNGDVSPPSGVTVNGQASATFTSTSGNDGTASADVDNQTVSTLIDVTEVTFSINDVSHEEGDPPGSAEAYTFTVTKTGTTSFFSSVDVQTADDTATAPSDYTALPATTLNFGPSDTTMQVTVFANEDTTFEPDEQFFVNLSNAFGGTISDGQGVGTIRNDDPDVAQVSINNVTISEPAGGTATATFTVSLSSPEASDVTVDYFTQDGSATASADYEAIAPQQLVFTPGQVSKPVSVTINADELSEDTENFFVELSNVSDNATLDDDTGEGTILDAVFPGQLLISEFRFRGPTFSAQEGIDGFRDEYVELYNTKNFPMTVAATDGSSGWTIASLNSSGTGADVLVVIPNGTVIPARGHFLAVNSDDGVVLKPNQGVFPAVGYSLNGYAVGDAFYATDISDNSGVAVFTSNNTANLIADTRLDAAGFEGLSGETADLFREGPGLASPGAVDGEYAFVRYMDSGTPQDTDNNAADFAFVATDGDSYGGMQSELGAPGPENCGCNPGNLFEDASPVQHNADIKASLVEPHGLATGPPNRVRDSTPNGCGGPNCALGTLEIRRRFRNNTGGFVTRLRFRLVDVTTLNSHNPGGAQADIRWITSSDMPLTTSLGNLTLRGTVIQEPPAQGKAGGVNSTGSITIPGGALAPNATVGVRFLIGVEAVGRFRFFVNVEALP